VTFSWPMSSRTGSILIWRALPAGRIWKQSGWRSIGRRTEDFEPRFSSLSARASPAAESPSESSPARRSPWERRPRPMARSMTATAGVPANAGGQGTAADVIRSPVP
jgi:hypothetical protein